MVPATVLTQSKPVSITAVRPVSDVVPKFRVTQPRHAKTFVTKSKSPIRRYLTRSPSSLTSNSPSRVIVVKAPVVSVAQGVIDSGCSRHVTRNMSYLSDFKELNGGYVSFGDLLLPIPFWAEAFNTTCYVHNRVLVNKPHNKTPYELLLGRTPSIGFMRPFGCHVTILNTLDSLGKFKGNVDEGFLVNGVTRLQALVDTKKVIVTEATIREALHLDNAEGMDCLPNEEIFAELARMGYEKPSTKLTFYKPFFSSQ
nr:retrovirus-related Pol polyprotein from transposon TNT 1-94 [Tanacetum cinerariifolium]